MIGLFRCIIKLEFSGFYIGKDYNGKMYKIKKNRHLRCKKGHDREFFAKSKKGFIIDTLIPVSDREAYAQR